MRTNRLLALAAAAVAIVLAAPEPAAAFDRDHVRPAGWSHGRDVRHWVYYPRYRHHYLTNGATDPYAYRYEPNGYYPYYNSAYWKPRKCVPLKRTHFVHPKYHQAWGAKKKHYDHVEWHTKHHGGHLRGHW